MEYKRRLVKTFVVVGSIFALGLAGACDGSTRRASVLSEGCTVNTDCNAPLVCAFRLCHDACKESRDCPNGERCVASDRPFDVCQLPAEKLCTYNSQCPVGQLCGVDGQCRDQCSTDRDCIGGQVCATGTCADSKELTNGKLPVQTGTDAGRSGSPCLYNTDCPAPQTCQGGTCRFECIGDRDCQAGSNCVRNVCKSMGDASSSTPDGAKTCFYNSDCTPLVCHAGVCVPECRADVDCPSGNRCNASLGKCEVVVANVPPDAPAGYGSPCSLPSDCTSPLVCGVVGQCVYECNTRFDCDWRKGFCCSSHSCVTGPVCAVDAGGPDASTSGPTDAGTPCTADLDCQDGLMCNGFELCVSGHCAPAAKGPCDDGNPCTADSCNEAQRSCSHTASPNVDVDKDGHYDIACGGTADDCDDTNATVYKGHPELCDLLDNNCDGAVDEGLWAAGAPIAVSDFGGSTAPYPTTNGPPSIVRYADGTFAAIGVSNNGSLVAGPHEVDGWHLDATLNPLAAATPLLKSTGTAAAWISLMRAATDGSSLAVGAFAAWGDTVPSGVCYVAQGTQSAILAASAKDLSGIVQSTLSTQFFPATGCGSQLSSCCSPLTASPPSFASNGPGYLLAWADNRATGSTATAYVYAAKMTAAGVVSGAHTVLPTLTDVTTSTASNGSLVTLAVGPSSSLVAWRWTTTNQARYALLDASASSVLAGPFDLQQAEDVMPTGAAFVGSSFALATQTANGSAIRVHRIDATKGLELPGTSVTIPNPTLGGDAHLAALGGGWVLTALRGNSVSFGRAREDLAGGFALTDVFTGGSTSAGLAPIDAKHAAIVWQDGKVRAALMTCQP